ncbi:MAG: GxxExxY protein [Christensenellales bacterium]|jgi:hypothetical protein
MENNMQIINSAAQAIYALRPPAVIDELELQNMVAEAFSSNKIEYKKEALCGKGCRVDFLLKGGVAVEIKARKRPRKVLMEQLSRYFGCEGISAILLVTNDAAHLPAEINGKPLIYINLKRRWGVAL